VAASKKRKRLYVIGAAATSLLAFAVVVHTPLARKLGIGGCPWEGKPPSAEKLEDYRAKTAANMRATTTAAARPAFGFELDRSTKADVMRWGGDKGLTCKEEVAGAAIRCTAEPPSTVTDIEDAYFRFEPGGTVVAVDIVHAGTSVALAVERMKTLGASVQKAAGAEPSATRGTPTEAHLGGGRSNQYALEFRFSDYAADITARNDADGSNAGAEIVIRETYQSLRAKPVANANAMPGVR
jgi:hypothetical protein